ncbi:MAG: GFA family protein [Anaerolineae bacterium]
MNYKPLSGGCLCGSVRYKLHAPAKSVEHCHCSQCRRAHGAMYASGAVLYTKDVQITAGEDNLALYGSSAGNWRKFCKTCGCHLFMVVDQFPEKIYVWVASLDGGAHPGHPADKEAHIFVESKAPWEQIPAETLQYAAMPSDIGIDQD